MNTNMDMEVFVMARKCGVKVNHMNDVPRLIEAFNAFGWFAKAKQYGDWYDDMKLRIEREHTDGSTSSTVA